MRKMLMLADREEISRRLADPWSTRRSVFGSVVIRVISPEVGRHGGRERYLVWSVALRSETETEPPVAGALQCRDHLAAG